MIVQGWDEQAGWSSEERKWVEYKRGGLVCTCILACTIRCRGECGCEKCRPSTRPALPASTIGCGRCL